MAITLGTLLGSFAVTTAPAKAKITRPTPIKHVVIIYQENHSFDNVLGKLCVLDSRCDGVTNGKLATGSTIKLKQADDVVPTMDHSIKGQQTAINGGKMNGFSKLQQCTATNNYQCYSQYYPSQIPNLSALARQFVISDRTFSMNPIPSFGAHLELVAQKLDGFSGQNPTETSASAGHSGWGCDSNRDTPWRPNASTQYRLIPSCVPDFNLDPVLYPFGGAYRATPAQHVPTIMDKLDKTNRQWKLYATAGPGINPYGWAICPTFAGCLYTSQHNNQVPSEQVITDAQNGNLPAFSVVLPSTPNSQHNMASMAEGDNWIGSVVSAIQSSPDWDSTAIFITYDDCGCFYDHVAPPNGWGIRMPTVIVSPYAKAGFTDSTPVTFSGMLAFTEHVFGLGALSTRDANAYDYENSFDFNQAPLGPTRMTHTQISPQELHYLRMHPTDPDDPT